MCRDDHITSKLSCQICEFLTILRFLNLFLTFYSLSFLLFWNILIFSSVSSVTQPWPTRWPHGLQHTRPPCPSPTPRVYPNSCPLSRWCRTTISSSVDPLSFCPQSFPASGYFQMSQLFASGGQSIRVSTSTSVLPMNTQDWSQVYKCL